MGKTFRVSKDAAGLATCRHGPCKNSIARDSLTITKTFLAATGTTTTARFHFQCFFEAELGPNRDHAADFDLEGDLEDFEKLDVHDQAKIESAFHGEITEPTDSQLGDEATARRALADIQQRERLFARHNARARTRTRRGSTAAVATASTQGPSSAPRHPTTSRVTAYSVFSRMTRARLSSKNWTAAKTSSFVKDQWELLTPSEKQEYETMAKTESGQHAKKAVIQAAGPKRHTVSKGKKKAKGPKKPPSAFVLFSAEHRPTIVKAHPGASFGDVAKMVGKAWREAEPSEKLKFSKQAEVAKRAALSSGGAIPQK